MDTVLLLSREKMKKRMKVCLRQSLCPVFTHSSLYHLSFVTIGRDIFFSSLFSKA